MYVTILAIAGFIVFVYVIAPILVWRKTWLAVQPTFVEVAADDPRLSEAVRVFFDEVAAQVVPLSFAPGPYLINPDSAPDTTSYIALFDKHSAGDGLAAMLVVGHVQPAAPVRTYAVEFTTEFTSGEELNTSNGTQSGGLPRLSWQESHALPAMADLATLYQVHRSLVAERNLARKPRPIDGRAATFAENVARQFQAHVDQSVLRLEPSGQRLAYTWRSGYGAVWRQLPPFLQIRRMLIKSRARSLMKRLGVSPDYDTVNYAQRYAHLSQEVLPTAMPVARPQSGT